MLSIVSVKIYLFHKRVCSLGPLPREHTYAFVTQKYIKIIIPFCDHLCLSLFIFLLRNWKSFTFGLLSVRILSVVPLFDTCRE